MGQEESLPEECQHLHPVHFGILHDYRVYKTLMRAQIRASQALHSADPRPEEYRPVTNKDPYAISAEYMRIAEQFRTTLGMQTFTYMMKDYGKYTFPKSYGSFQPGDLQTISELPSFKLKFPKNLGKMLLNVVYWVIFVSSIPMEALENGVVRGWMASEPLFVWLGKGIGKMIGVLYRGWKRFSPVQYLLAALIPEKTPQALTAARTKRLTALIPSNNA